MGRTGRWAGNAGARLGPAGALWLGMQLLCAPAAADCLFSDLRWSADGRALEFLAGPLDDPRTLRYDIETRSLRCLDPRVNDPRWTPERVLFRDRFGVFEVRHDDATTQTLLLLPEGSGSFLRDFGEDARGGVLVWTYDHARGTHAIDVLSRGRLTRLPGDLTGSEALRTWKERNRAVRFQFGGGRFVRSSCVRRPARQDRLCIESVGRRGPGPAFRMTLGPPGRVQVVHNQCAPAGVATSRDSTRILVNLFEEVDDKGRSEVLACWVVDWSNAVRVSELLLPDPRPVHGEQTAWVHWTSERAALWADTAGQLLAIDLAERQSRTLVPAGAPPARQPLFRVVALESKRASDIEAGVEALRSAGVETAVREQDGRFELQAGAWSLQADAEKRVEFLRQRGFSGALVRRGHVGDLAPGVVFGWASDGGSRGAYVRHVRSASGVYSEIWMAEGRGQPVLLVGSFAEFSLTPQQP
jgi:hypothetical protein